MTSHYLNQCWPSSPTHICGTTGRWVNSLRLSVCVSKLNITGSDNVLSTERRQAIISTNAGILLIGPWGTNFSETLIEIYILSFKKMHLQMSRKWWWFCLGLNELTLPVLKPEYSNQTVPYVARPSAAMITCQIVRSLSSRRTYFNYLCQLSLENYWKCKCISEFTWNEFSTTQANSNRSIAHLHGFRVEFWIMSRVLLWFHLSFILVFLKNTQMSWWTNSTKKVCPQTFNMLVFNE